MLDSLRSRLVLANLLITLLGLAVVVVVFTLLLVNRSTQVKISDRTEQARDISTQVERLYARNASSKDLQPLVDTASRILSARIIIVRPDGVWAVDSARATPFYTGTWKPDPRALQAGRAAATQVRSDNLYRFQAPIHGTHRPNGGAVLLIVRVTQVRPSLSSLAFFILVAVGTILVVWLLIGLYFAYSMSRPLFQIMHATERMAVGDYNARVNIRGEGEIARLGSGFNSMAERVQRGNQVLKDLVANVSHDLRTPLTMIAGYSQAILDGTARAGEIEDSAEIIHEEAEKMQRMVDDLLQLTRLESGLLKLDRRPVSVRPFVEHILDRTSRMYADCGPASLHNLVPAALPQMDVDPVQLERTLRNLLENALQHTPPGGSITVDARATDRGWIEISVSDTGAGISPEELTRIFERFYRSDRSREDRGHSGLGLAIVREIVEAHGGRVSAESEMGRGTTFRFTVPAARGARASAEGRSAAAS